MPKRKENKEKDEELRDDALQTLKDKTRSTRVEDENGKAERKMIDFEKVWTDKKAMKEEELNLIKG